MNQILKLSRLLLATSILTMFACILLAIQQFQIRHLRTENIENLRLLKDFQTSQLEFDKAVTERLVDL